MLPVATRSFSAAVVVLSEAVLVVFEACVPVVERCRFACVVF